MIQVLTTPSKLRYLYCPLLKTTVTQGSTERTYWKVVVLSSRQGGVFQVYGTSKSIEPSLDGLTSNESCHEEMGLI